MSEQEELLTDETSLSWSEKYLGLSLKKIILIAVFVIVIGIYLGDLFFGNNSLDALWRLQEYEQSLATEVEELKSENALMQKEYFELKEITTNE